MFSKQGQGKNKQMFVVKRNYQTKVSKETYYRDETYMTLERVNKEAPP